ncbi:MAG: hypothetical protein IT204_05170 [Fimbriimonadaceae bacterium]|nr:hypothetical protein [Fimbriimonadaceae bacterium]
MLEAVDLTLKLSKAEYKEAMGGPHGVVNRLRRIQRRCVEGRVPVCLVFEGWDAAGKGTLISRLVERLDPRGFAVHPISAPLADERLRPFLWRFWMKLPASGHIGIFDRSWYGRVLVERIDKLVAEREVQDALLQISEFERQLAADGMVISKFFLHISKKEQKQRFKECEKDPFLAWKIQDEDWRHHKQYDKYVIAIEEMLAQTSRSAAPWTIVESTCLRWAQVKVFRTICDQVEQELLRRGVPDPDLMAEEEAVPPPNATALDPPDTPPPAAAVTTAPRRRRTKTATPAADDE